MIIRTTTEKIWPHNNVRQKAYVTKSDKKALNSTEGGGKRHLGIAARRTTLQRSCHRHKTQQCCGGNEQQSNPRASPLSSISIPCTATCECRCRWLAGQAQQRGAADKSGSRDLVRPLRRRERCLRREIGREQPFKQIPGPKPWRWASRSAQLIASSSGGAWPRWAMEGHTGPRSAYCDLRRSVSPESVFLGAFSVPRDRRY